MKKTRMPQRLLALVLVLMMLISVLPVSAMAAELTLEEENAIIAAPEPPALPDYFTEQEQLILAAAAGQLTLLDINKPMPLLDGEEAFRTMHQTAPHIPVIMSSGYNEQEVTGRFTAGSPAGFIQKPYQMDTLRAVFRLTLASGASRRRMDDRTPKE